METLKVVTLSPSKSRLVPRGKKPPMPAWLKAEVEAERAKRRSTKR